MGTFFWHFFFFGKIYCIFQFYIVYLYIGSIGYVTTFYILAIVSSFPIILTLIYAFLNRSNNNNEFENENKLIGVEEGNLEKQINSKIIPPNSLIFLLFLFILLYVGVETGYGGWVTTFALQV